MKASEKKIISLEERQRFVYLKYRFLPSSKFTIEQICFIIRKTKTTVKKWCVNGTLKHDNFIISGEILCDYLLNYRIAEYNLNYYHINRFSDEIASYEKKLIDIKLKVDNLKNDYNILMGMLPLDKMNGLDEIVYDEFYIVPFYP